MKTLKAILWWIAEQFGFGKPLCRMTGLDGRIYWVQYDQVSWYFYFVEDASGNSCPNGFDLAPGVHICPGCWRGTESPTVILRRHAA